MCGGGGRAQVRRRLTTSRAAPVPRSNAPTPNHRPTSEPVTGSSAVDWTAATAAGSIGGLVVDPTTVVVVPRVVVVVVLVAAVVVVVDDVEDIDEVVEVVLLVLVLVVLLVLVVVLVAGAAVTETATGA